LLKSAEARIKVLHCYRTYFPDSQGGGEEAIRQISLATQAEGASSTIFALSRKPHPAIIHREEATVVRSYSWAAPASCNLGTPYAILTFRRLVRASDIVHYHFPWPFADVLHLCANTDDRPTVMTYHSDVVRQRLLGRLYRPLMISMLSSMNAVVATSEAYAHSSAILRHHVPEDRLRVIPLGIVENSYCNALRDGNLISVERRFDLAPNEYFLSLGVLRYYKGLHTLIKAARTVDCPIVIAGDGPLREELERSTRDMPPGRVRFLGFVSESEKLALMTNCRAFVLPSHLRSEAFGMVLVEAAMLGKPMISCELGTGTSFVNLHEETGLVVLPDNAESLGAAMRRLLADGTAAVKWGLRARERYLQLFSGRSLGKSYFDLYQSLLR
jgi:glycosyltransferase involved in cell wall biosynthesis